jgi:hypothetical protein
MLLFLFGLLILGPIAISLTVGFGQLIGLALKNIFKNLS